MNKITIKPVESEELKVNVKTVPLNPVQIIGETTFSAYHSKVWAEGSDEEVAKLGGEHSSKGWSEVTKGIAEQAEQDISEQTAKSIEEIKEQENLSLTNITNQEQESLQNLRNQETDSIANIVEQEATSISNVIEQEQESVEKVETEGSEQVALATEQANIATTKAEESSVSADSAEIYKNRCEEIFQRIGTAIKIKGRVDRLEDLPMVGNLDGDAYLVGAEGLTSYPEYYWYQNHWEYLGTSGGGGTWGTITGDITTQTDLQDALSTKLENTALDDSSLTIKGNPSTAKYSVNIGNQSKAALSSVSVGNISTCEGNSSIAIGFNSKANYSNSIAVGAYTTCNGTNSIQIGHGGTNNENNSFYVGFSNSNYKLLDSTGKIPSDRIQDIYQEKLDITLLEGATI